ncbi:MAG: N-acetyl-gamma-glutamyl-phosphate reductase [Lewinellaceae bacterium]|nr:N-acetyl-gamma-glutamyl-phosphate reductase [Lewinellaceae bacterium]
MRRVGIIGGTGYVAGELLRCLVHHPEVEPGFVYSHSQPGKPVSGVHQDLQGELNLNFTDKIDPEVDVVFLCLGHGKSKEFIAGHTFNAHTRIIDLGNDFRLEADRHFLKKNFVYGLPELNGAVIPNATAIANPGCFATAIQLALLPLANARLLDGAVHIHATTGSTGAGASLSETSHFSWRNNNLSVYKAFSHQHLGEISESLQALQKAPVPELNFLPLRGNFTRGILATAYLDSPIAGQDLQLLYRDFYKNAPFTKVVDVPVHLKQVVNTNHCFLQVQKIGGKVLITSAIDNLLKGAAGQAIQNMNLMLGLDERTGLHFKANYF